VFGVPLRLQRVTVDIDRPDFMFNGIYRQSQWIVVAVMVLQMALREYLVRSR
jgi:hypothetical protein